MRLAEQRAWDALRRAAAGPGLALERVENLLAAGFPDVLAIAAGGIVSAVELKAVEKAPARAETRLLGREGLSAEQRNWHLAWTALGGRSMLVVRAERQFLGIRLDKHNIDLVNNLSLTDLVAAAAARSAPEIIAALRSRLWRTST